MTNPNPDNRIPISSKPKQKEPPSPATIQMLLDNGLVEEVMRYEKIFNKRLRPLTEEELRQKALEDLAKSQVEFWLGQLITKDKRMLTLKDIVRKLSPHEDAVLVHGESGTGKELIARALHGDRRGDFKALNCAGLPENLVESILFGYVRGSFTGADKDTKGLLLSAENGTIFLDEIGELPLAAQAKLLRALQEKTIMRIGSTVEEKINCRVVAASHHNLQEMVESAQFRLDLYARLSTFEVTTVPIRDRLEDVPLIVNNLDSTCYASETLAFWNSYPYKLNVRDIQRLVRRYQVLGKASL